MLSVGRSPRTATDRELVRTEAFRDFQVHCQVAGTVERQNGGVQLQIDLTSTANRSSDASRETDTSSRRIQKTFRINGVSRRSAEFVGELKAVLFSAEDIHLVGGPPSGRRSYIDILVSQLVRTYLTDLQDYNRISVQRNHLLKSVRAGDARPAELDFWDIQLAVYGAKIMDARVKAVDSLCAVSQPIHGQLTGSGAELKLSYLPSLDTGGYEDVRDLTERIIETIRRHRNRDVAAGFGLLGPHRDDLGLSIGQQDVSTFASRGQARIAVLSMKLGEAQLLADSTGDQPIILLDDVMSELDPTRRSHVLERTLMYEQVLVTSAEPELADIFGDHDLNRICVAAGAAVVKPRSR